MDSSSNYGNISTGNVNIAVVAIVTTIAISVCLLVILVIVPFVKHLYMRLLRLLLPQHAGLHQAETGESGRTEIIHQLNTGESTSTGLDLAILSSLPVLEFHKEDFTGLHKTERAEILECVVCLCVLEEGYLVRILPNCNHIFHVGCIDKWLGSHDTCPICRAGVRPIAEDFDHVV